MNMETKFTPAIANQMTIMSPEGVPEVLQSGSSISLMPEQKLTTANADIAVDAKVSQEDIQGSVLTLPAVVSDAPVYVAAYCRVSTEDPTQEDSLAAQEAHWKQVIGDHEGWVLTEVYAERESATHADTRPELMRLMNDCAERKVSIILTKSVSRFARNTVDCLNLVRTLKGLGVSIIFEKENIDTGAMTSELFLSILASLAAEESRSISQNVKLGYRHRFQAGEYKYRRPPFGYIALEGDLVVDPEEAAVVEEIFKAVLQGVRPSEIANALIRQGISTKYSTTWTANTVIAIISNLTYTGDALLQKTYKDDDYKARHNKGELDQFYIPDHHEAIISREVFVLANDRLGFSNPYERIERAQSQRESSEDDDKGRVTVIRATPKVSGGQAGILRVAAYCRVSTDQEEQESSYEVQCSHYHNLITTHTGWSLAGIYADEGISGTSLKHRDGFNHMIADAEAGKIDLILTKSISRFARNTLDCLTVVRKLKEKGIGVTFEKEGIDTLDGTGEVILTILASIAQQESASISQNIRLGIQYRFQQGIPMVNCSRFLGYDKDKKGRLVINDAQAAIVRRIYRDFLDGFSLDMIANDLRREGVRSGSGCTTWHTSSVRYILSNEKYEGDLLLQKTLIEDFLTHKMVRNKGQLPQYYVENAHAPIIPRTIFERAAEELWLRANHGKKGGMHFGSRTALKGRTVCTCGEKMKRLRRNEPVFVCASCGAMVLEKDVKKQVMDAVDALPLHRADITVLIAEARETLNDDEHFIRAMARRREWYLLNLLSSEGDMNTKAECVDEADFRTRTRRRIVAWNDDQIVRLLQVVIPGMKVTFKGGLEI